MAFDPASMAALTADDIAYLTHELGQQMRADALAHIKKLSRQAAAGDNEALTHLTASCAASLAVSVLQHIAALSAADPDGLEHRAMLAALPGLADTVVMAALHAALVAYGDMRAASLAMEPHLLDISHSIGLSIWEEVRDAVVSYKQNPSVGLRQSAKGSTIFTVPPGA